MNRLKNGDTGCFAKAIYAFLLRSHPEVECITQVTGKGCNLSDGEGLIIPCCRLITGLNKFVSTA